MAWLPSVVTSAPASEPVTTAEAKAQCSIDSSDTSFDTMMGTLITTAREHVERFTGLALITQTRVLRASCFDDLERLPAGPVSSVDSVTYLDGDGAQQTLSTDVYESVLIGLEPAIRLKINQSWPAIRAVSDAVRVTAGCGYGDAEDVPTPIKHAMLMLIAHWFANRETVNIGNIVNEVPHAVNALLSNYRIF